MSMCDGASSLCLEGGGGGGARACMYMFVVALSL